MYKFKDYYGNTVRFSMEKHPFANNPKHVWVICKFHNQWLLTEHKRRGIEFPGGKVEDNESANDAAIREVFEETGATVDTLVYIGQYEVLGKGGIIVKNVYFAEIKKIEKQKTYFETIGPVLLSEFPNDIKMNPKFSFMMKDEVLERSLERIKNLESKK